MKQFIFNICIFLLYFLSACSDNNVPKDLSGENGNNNPDKETITISTEINSRTVITEFKNEDKMNVFIKEYNTLGSNDFISDKVIAKYNQNAWSTDPEVIINTDETAFIYSFFPYNKEITSPLNVPVDANTQTDYLYSGKGVMVSTQNSNAKLTLSHAMSLLSFNIIKSNYKGEGILENIIIGGDKFKVAGTLNIETGIITPIDEGIITITPKTIITENGWNSKLPETYTLPFESTGLNTKVTFVIDGKEYNLSLPKIKIERGMKYIFRIGLSENNLVLFESETTIVPLQKNDDDISNINGVSVVKFNFKGKSLVLPDINGETMIPGIVKWGDESVNDIYSLSKSHNYENKDKTYNIEIENWNALNIKFKNIKGISEIDLSKFK